MRYRWTVISYEDDGHGGGPPGDERMRCCADRETVCGLRIAKTTGRTQQHRIRCPGDHHHRGRLYHTSSVARIRDYFFN